MIDRHFRRVKLETRKTEALPGRKDGSRGRAKRVRAWAINETTGFAWAACACVSISLPAPQPCSLPTLLSTLRPEQPVGPYTPRPHPANCFCSLSAALRLSGRGRLFGRLKHHGLCQRTSPICSTAPSFAAFLPNRHRIRAETIRNSGGPA